MRTIPVIVMAIFCMNSLKAQTITIEKVFAFKITGYQERLNDSITLVQVILPDGWPVAIKEKQMGVLRHCYRKGVPFDTASVGAGRCQLIKGNYYYFAIKRYKNQQAIEGDLLYTLMKIPLTYDGLLLKIMNRCVSFTGVNENVWMQPNDIFTNTQQQERAILDSMVADIQYTGRVMQEQMPAQNQTIRGGLYDGKKLFSAMQDITRAELETFLQYMIVRPNNYAGNTWKISEIFATWMTSETPRVIEK